MCPQKTLACRIGRRCHSCARGGVTSYTCKVGIPSSVGFTFPLSPGCTHLVLLQGGLWSTRWWTLERERATLLSLALAAGFLCSRCVQLRSGCCTSCIKAQNWVGWTQGRVLLRHPLTLHIVGDDAISEREDDDEGPEVHPATLSEVVDPLALGSCLEGDVLLAGTYRLLGAPGTGAG